MAAEHLLECGFLHYAYVGAPSGVNWCRWRREGFCRRLAEAGVEKIAVRTHAELDLANHDAVLRFFKQERPEYVFLAAAKVGGILANNTRPAEFIDENLSIQLNVIEAARKFNVKRLLFLGSSCIYPRDCPQPIKEEYMLTGPLEMTNRSYAVAKIAGIEMCWASNRQYGTQYVALMPTNLYGIGDNPSYATFQLFGKPGACPVRPSHPAAIMATAESQPPLAGMYIGV